MANETEVILLDVQFDESVVTNAITAVQDYTNQIDTLKESQKQLEAQGQKNSDQYVRQAADIKSLSTQVRQNQRVVEANASAQRKTQGYLNGLKKSIQELTVQYDGLTKEQLENTTAGTDLQKRIKSMSDELKKHKSAIGDNRLEVGAYREGFIEAGKQINIAGVNVGNTLKDITEINEKFFGTMIQGFKESGLQAKLFGTTLRTVLTVTGIGLFIAALGTIIAYWDDIAEAMGLAEDKSKSFFKTQSEGLDRTFDLLEQYKKELEVINRLLELQGKGGNKVFDNNADAILKEIALLQERQRIVQETLKLVSLDASGQARFRTIVEATAFRQEIDRIRKDFDGKETKEIQEELIKQFRELSQQIVNTKNNLVLLRAEQKKFNDDNRLVNAETDAAITSQDDITQLKAREDALTKINQAELNATEVQIKILRAGNELKRQEYEKDAKNKAQSEEAKRYAERATLEASKQILAALSGLFDQGTAENKFFALSSIGIDTAQAISALTARSEQNPANAVTFGGAAIAQYAAGIVRILNNIAQAKRLLNFAMGGLVTPVIEGFAGGGITGRRIMPWHGKPIRRANGDNRLATVKVGEVVLNERQQAALGGDRTFRSIGVPGFADGGLVARSASAQASGRFDMNHMSRTFENVMKKVKIYTRITDINKLNARVNATKVTSELR